MRSWSFTPVPHEATDRFEVAEYGALLDLYQKAHRLRWAAFEVTARDLEQRWGIPKSRALRLLDKLQAAGLVELVRGARNRPTTVRVFDPVKEKEECVGQARGQGTGQEPGQQDAASSADIEDDGTSHGTSRGTSTGTTTPESGPKSTTFEPLELELEQQHTHTSARAEHGAPDGDLLGGLAPQAAQALRRAGLTNPEAVAALTVTELRSRPGIGAKSLAAIVTWLQGRGLALRADTPRPPKATLKGPMPQAWANAWNGLHPAGPRYVWDHIRDPGRLGRVAEVVPDPERAERVFRLFLEADRAAPLFPHDEAPTIAKLLKVSHLQNFAIKAASQAVASAPARHRTRAELAAAEAAERERFKREQREKRERNPSTQGSRHEDQPDSP